MKSQVNYIIIKHKEKPHLPAKKALISNSMSVLKKTITKLLNFTMSKPLQTIYSEDGQVITKISEIKPGDTIIASHEAADKEFESAILTHVQEENKETDKHIDVIKEFVPQELGEINYESVRKSVPSNVLKFEAIQQDSQAKQQAKLLADEFIIFKDIPKHSASIDEKAMEVVKRNTISTSAGCIIKMRTAIVGPAKGGKTTFYQILSNILSSCFISSGQFKKCFIFKFDMEELKNAITNPIEFYQEFIQIIFQRIGIQKKNLDSHVEMLINYFQQLPNSTHVPSFLKSFYLSSDFRQSASKLSIIAENIHKIIKNRSKLTSWFKYVSLLPKLISEAFDFDNILFNIDHFDDSNIEIHPNESFMEKSKPIKLFEYMKSMIRQENFLISCHDEEKLFDVLESSSSNSINLIDGTDFVSIVGSDNENHQNNYEIQLTFESKTISINANDCDGCSGFLSKFDEIIHSSEKIENEEDKLNLLSLSESLCFNVILSKELNELHLTDVKIVKINE